jgi:hypothetical protein
MNFFKCHFWQKYCASITLTPPGCHDNNILSLVWDQGYQIGRIFAYIQVIVYFGSYLKITEVGSPIFWILFSSVMCTFWQKLNRATYFGRFFTYSFGHPVLHLKMLTLKVLLPFPPLIDSQPSHLKHFLLKAMNAGIKFCGLDESVV